MALLLVQVVQRAVVLRVLEEEKRDVQMVSKAGPQAGAVVLEGRRLPDGSLTSSWPNWSTESQ